MQQKFDFKSVGSWQKEGKKLEEEQSGMKGQ